MSMRDEAERLQRSSETEGVERLYETVGPLLLRTLTGKFGVPPDDAEALVEEVFIAYLTASAVADPESWLIAAAVSGANAYRQSRDISRRVEAPPPDATAEETRAVRDVLFVRKALVALPERAREALRLRFQEHLTYDEIAVRLDVSKFYAESLVTKAVSILRAYERDREGER